MSNFKLFQIFSLILYHFCFTDIYIKIFIDILPIFFVLIDRKQIYIETKETKSTQVVNKREPKHRQQRRQETTRELPTPQPSKEVYNRMCIISTIQISPSPQVENKINFNYLGGEDLVLKHHQIPCALEIPEQAQQGCQPNFSAFFTHSSSLPRKKSVEDRMREDPTDSDN